MRFINHSVYLYAYSPNVARQQLNESITTATNTHATIKGFLISFLCGPSRIKESRRLVLPRKFCFLSDIIDWLLIVTGARGSVVG
jgi:hypothetical protein